MSGAVQLLRRMARPIFLAAALAADSARECYWFVRLGRLGAGTRIYPRALIYSPRFVCIGTNVSINDFVHIRGLGGVEIGDDTLIAPHVVITSQSHDVGTLAKGELYRRTNTAAPVRIGKNVWIGSGAIILPGVSIGDGAVVAAGAVVNGDVKARTLVAGVPARLIRVLVPE